ncbi:NAD(P)-binding protein [Choiromyces venosus 120613-1]|uniref:NAD(P)-binding protein n=1 Tax=Choiromyces venosus 120613-1 TaxID=1336337 RepID=A0A3N4JL84_9PEZI|nr:NAD(P)-binding protein [Choiromyces venosus 120613-1]
MSGNNSQKVALVIGASRGIGRQVAIDLAHAGYIVVLAAKSVTDESKPHTFPPDPNSPQSTITTVAREITESGGTALAIPVDVRFEASINSLIQTTMSEFSKINVVIYNSGAIYWSALATTPTSRFRLLQQVNPEGLYMTLQAIIPILQKQRIGRVVVVCPPIYSRFFRGKTAYAVGKVGMSVMVKGLAMDWERQGEKGLGICGIWPAVAIHSGATGRADQKQLRHATIFSDAIIAMINAPVKTINGLLNTDEDFLKKQVGVTDFSKYSLVPGSVPRRIMPADFPDLTVAEQDDEGDRIDSAKERATKL